MAAATQMTVVGVFEDRDTADRAIDALRSAGFGPEQIGVVTRGDETSRLPRNADINMDGVDDDDAAADRAGEGASIGALSGAAIGGLVGLGVLSGVIPVIGPALAGGTLAVILSNAAGGAAIAGVAGALLGWGIPEEEARYYEGELTAGRTIVTVQADRRFDEARSILRSYGAYEATSPTNSTSGLI